MELLMAFQWGLKTEISFPDGSLMFFGDNDVNFMIELYWSQAEGSEFIPRLKFLTVQPCIAKNLYSSFYKNENNKEPKFFVKKFPRKVVVQRFLIAAIAASFETYSNKTQMLEALDALRDIDNITNEVDSLEKLLELISKKG